MGVIYGLIALWGDIFVKCTLGVCHGICLSVSICLVGLCPFSMVRYLMDQTQLCWGWGCCFVDFLFLGGLLITFLGKVFSFYPFLDPMTLVIILYVTNIGAQGL